MSKTRKKIKQNKNIVNKLDIDIELRIEKIEDEKVKEKTGKLKMNSDQLITIRLKLSIEIPQL